MFAKEESSYPLGFSLEELKAFSALLSPGSPMHSATLQVIAEYDEALQSSELLHQVQCRQWH